MCLVLNLSIAGLNFLILGLFVVMMNCGNPNIVTYEETIAPKELFIPETKKPITTDNYPVNFKDKAFTSPTFNQYIQEISHSCRRSNGWWNNLSLSCFCHEDHIFHANYGCLPTRIWEIWNPDLVDEFIPEFNLAFALQGITFETKEIASSVYFSQDTLDKLDAIKTGSLFIMDANPLLTRKHLLDLYRSEKTINSSEEFREACLKGATNTDLFPSENNWIEKACIQSAHFWFDIYRDQSNSSDKFDISSIAAGEKCQPWCMRVISPRQNNKEIFSVVAGKGKNYLHRTIVYRSEALESKSLYTVLHANGQIIGWLVDRTNFAGSGDYLQYSRDIWFPEDTTKIYSEHWMDKDKYKLGRQFTLEQCESLMDISSHNLGVFVFEYGVLYPSIYNDKIHFISDAQSCVQGYLEPSTDEENYDRFSWSHGQMIVDILFEHSKQVDIWISNKTIRDDLSLDEYLKKLDHIFNVLKIRSVVISFQWYPLSHQSQKIFYEWIQRNQKIVFLLGAGNAEGKNPEGFIPSSLQGLLPNLLVVAAYDKTTGRLRPNSNHGKNHADIAAIDTCSEQGPTIRHCATSGAAPRAAAAALYLMSVFPHCDIRSIIHALRITCKAEDLDVQCGGSIDQIAAQVFLSTMPCSGYYPE